jgi:hypothetical protein
MVNEFMECMKSTTEEACSTIKKSKDNMAWYYNPSTRVQVWR